MKCPNCKKEELLPARTNENNSAVDGLKCPYCCNVYRLNSSNHLVLIGAGNPVPVGTKEAPHPERVTLTQLTSFSSPQPSIYNQYGLLTSEAQAEIRTRLKNGELPPKIVKDMKCKPWQVYGIRKRLLKESPNAIPESKLTRSPRPSSLTEQDYGSPKKEPLATRVVRTREEVLPNEFDFALLLHRAKNGFVLTDTHDAVYVYTQLTDVIEHVRKWGAK